MIKFVLLDLDDTILDFGYSESVALQALLREHGLEPTEELVARYSAINDSYWKRLEWKVIVIKKHEKIKNNGDDFKYYNS